jgi:uncharacterized RDD family membrane protein YckC
VSDSKTKAPKLFQPIGIGRRRDLDGVVLASFGQRAVAWLIDFALVALLVGIASIPSVMAAGAKSGNYDLHINPFHGWALLSLPAYFGLVTFWGQGRTLGKRWLGIRVVSLTHDHLSLWHSLERSLGYDASMLEGGFGFIQYFTHPNCQTVHDRIAETIVIMQTKTPAPADSPETGA